MRIAFWTAVLATLLLLDVGCSDIKVRAASDVSNAPSCFKDSDCPDNECRTGTCNTTTRQCEYEQAPDTCYIDGECKAAGTTTQKGCQLCDPSNSTESWTDKTCKDSEICSPETGECIDDVPEADVTSGEDVTTSPEPDGGEQTDDVTGTEPPDCSALTTDDCTLDYQLVSDVCEPVYAAVDSPCDDADDTTTGDVCDGSGLCKGTPVDCSELPVNDCTTGYTVTAGTCVPVFADNDTACEDDDLCSTESICTDGVCNATAFKECPIDNDCISDNLCNPTTGNCEPVNLPNGTDCGDGNPCFPSECVDGSCTSLPPVDCDDGIACSDDVCKPTSGDCIYDFVDSACDDNNPCTADVCTANGCTNEPLENFAGCTTADSVDGICYNDSCTPTQRHEPSLGLSFLCPEYSKKIPAVVGHGGKFYAALNYSSPSVNKFTGLCDQTSVARTRLVKLTNGGASAVLMGAATATTNHLHSNHSVGSNSSVGVIDTSNDTASFTEGLSTTVSDVVGTDNTFRAGVKRYTSVFGITPSTYHQLMVGDDGIALYCTTSASSGESVCPFTIFGNLPMNTSMSDFQFKAVEMIVGTPKCTPPAICLGTSVLETYIASSMMSGWVDIFYAGQNNTSFSHIWDKSPGLTPSNVVNGSAFHNSAAWFFGDNGLLIRCQGGSCAEVIKPEGMNPRFIDAWNSGEKLVFLTYDDGSYGFHVLTDGTLNTSASDWTITPFDETQIQFGDVMTSITGSSGTGLMIGGYNGFGNDWVVWSYQAE